MIDAPDGATAVALCAAHTGPLDLVVTDMVMPGMTAQRTCCPGPCDASWDPGHVHVGLHRGRRAPGQHVLEPGAAFLDKPFTVQTLIRAVQGALSKT